MAPALLLLDGVPAPVLSATFEIFFPDPERPLWAGPDATRRPDGRDVGYMLSIEVDERSGEDGAAAPRAQAIPVWRALGGRHPPLAELASLDLGPPLVAADADWEASVGNDAPHLVANRMRFGGWEDGGRALRVRWEARTGWRHPLLLPENEGRATDPGAFLFEGPAAFDGIAASVADPGAADAFVRAQWGEAVFAGLERVVRRREVPPGAPPPETARVIYRPRKPGG